MALSIKPQHLKRYKDILRLLYKYGRSDLRTEIEKEELLAGSELSERGECQARELADELERMGPTYVKLGQLLSSRADLFPEAFLQALTRLQDDVKPFAYADVEAIIERELNVRISKAFSSVEMQPLAAASLGQVHRAALRDGRQVVLKVQRPDIQEQVVLDFEAITELAQFLEDHTTFGRKYRLTRIVDELKTTFLQELDYQREAANLTKLAENLKEFPRLQVPLPVADYTTARVLTMDYVRGTKITTLSPLARLDIDGERLADELFQAYLKQVLVDGTFHADPHPGNVFLTDDGRIALLDLGMVGHTTPAMQEHLLKLLVAITERNSDDAVEIILSISETSEDFQARGVPPQNRPAHYAAG